jgi:serine/threonine protein kinase
MDTNSLKQKYGRYQIVKLLGEGAMGRVYLAEDPVLDRLVALKIIALKIDNDQETKQEYINRFNLEAKASARLNHPSIVTIYDAGEDDGEPWIAFEFVKGLRLDKLLHSHRQLPFEKVRTILSQLASALHYAHELGIIHRDIKPQNILIDERTSIAKLADFGVAKAPWAGYTREGNCVGSPGYMSPEQIDGGKVDARSDLFSLGIVLYELITGKHPFIKDSIPATFFATVNGQYQPLSELRQGVPSDLYALVSGLLQAQRDKRFQSAGDILNALKNMDGEGVSKNLQGDKKSESFVKKIRDTARRYSTHQNVLLFKEICIDIVDLIKKIFYQMYQRSPGFFKKSKRSLTRKVSRNFPFITGLLFAHKRFVLAVVLSCFVVSAFLFFIKPGCESQKKSHQITLKKTHGLKKAGEDLDHLFSAHLFDSLKKVTDQLIEKHGKDLKTAVIQARLALKEGNYDDALRQFREIVDNGGGRSVKENRDALTKDIEDIFTEGEASEALIELCAGPLKEVIIPVTDEWAKHDHYWVRWNTVSVCNKIDKSVDMVEVYILDLLTAGSMRTRIKAAEFLGESGDKRAIAPLEEVSSRGFRDPIVSSKATRVLEEYFYKDK